MNISIVSYFLGSMLKIEATCMFLPFFCSIIYQEKVGIVYFFVGIITYIIGLFFTNRKIKNKEFYISESFITVAFGWILLSIVGAVPFVITKEIPNYIDAIFETVSGFTTTGATIIDDVEIISHASLLWRSFTHWIGGMGVLCLMLAILPTNSDNMLIMKAELTGPEVGKLLPKVADTAKILYKIYLVMTIIMIICYVISGMPIFDSICIGFGTAGTGGFSVKNSSCSDYNIISRTLITVFMLLFGINFNLYYFLIVKKFKEVIHSEELKIYLLIVLISAVGISVNIINMYPNIFSAIHSAFFHVSSVITTTGYSIDAYSSWPLFSKNILLLLMFVGACAGSTAGGLKVMRVIIGVKLAFAELKYQIHPNSVNIIKFEGHPVSNATKRTISVYFVIYALIFAVGMIIISFENFDFETTFSTVASTFNNIGVALGDVGYMQSFSKFNYLSKLTFTFLMLTGRLELLPMLIIFSRNTWNRQR